VEQIFNRDDFCDVTGIVKSAEQTTSCEIVVRMSRDRVMTDPTSRSEFALLGLNDLPEKNGLLIYINLFQHRFVMLAGSGIMDKMGKEWLKGYSEMLQQRFRGYQFGFGLHDVVARMAGDLKKYFPPIGDQSEEQEKK